ncbi:inhibitor of growth protein 3 [Geosmithia morbida]|uniref:Chromatin modification-related protein n=1 Tax=Geosmithia morbida TaxID=1094350 RepID=A0A9P5D110_9HYPO|nr:inhibitor of growth protein 3 [Geosmithia morbida]KAF4123333.1 inhibitor of growth protein 3 [Geosmithia morbida]
MPRDDLSIDFVRGMPQVESVDPGVILDDWINRVQNLPEEIRFVHEEITEKDRQFNECTRIIDDRDAKIQKWIKTNGSHEPNPKEDTLRAQIRENFARADEIQRDKIALTQKLSLVMDKHLRALDIQIKGLYDRSEPGFNNPDEIPSLVRPSAANVAAPAVQPISTASTISVSGPAAAAGPPVTSSNPTLARLPSHAQVRNAQNQQNTQQHHASSAPATPAVSMIVNRQQRENSAGPASKRGGRAGSGLNPVLSTSSGLARHSSLGPGTPKGVASPSPSGVVRAGSAGPRATSVKGTAGPGSRRGTPSSTGRKKPPKSSLSRVKKASNRNSPASTADSDLSDAVSGSENEDVDGRSRATPTGGTKDTEGDETMMDVEEEEEDGSDDKKYCLCHNVSYGDMVACDNDDCPYEWFHWSCVSLKSEPNGTWYCPVCAEKFGRKTK